MKDVVEQKSVLAITRRNYKEYGQSVIENRALPDFRDGLKPVARRILWGMLKLGLTPSSPYVKCARIVGDVMGKYHPHGDSSIFQALVKMSQTQLPVHLVEGEGNFGGVIDNAASMRYVEAKLSKYAHQVMLAPEYLAVTPLVPNYDDKDVEPLYLPALLPNLILNGASGIAVAVTCGIPPLQLDPLMPIMEKMLNGQSVSEKALRKSVYFNWRYGGIFDGKESDIETWIETGNGALAFIPEFEENEAARTITAISAAPQFNWDLLVGKLININQVSEVLNLSNAKNGIRFVVKLKNTVNDEEYEKTSDKVKSMFRRSLSMATNVTHRIDENTVDFHSLNLSNLLSRWIEYRVDLEKRAQECIIQGLTQKLLYQDLMLLACDNLQIIIRALESTNPVKVISDKLKITENQANQILDLQVRRLSSLSRDKVKQTIVTLNQDKKIAKNYLKSPEPKIISDLNRLHSLIQ